MKSRGLLAVCAGLGVIVAVTAGLQGAARFSGPRWVPDWNPGVPTMHPRGSQPARPSQLSKPTGDSLDVGTILLWVAIGLGVIVLVVLAYVFWRWLAGLPPRSGRGLEGLDDVSGPPPEPEQLPEPEPEPDAPVLRSGVEEALRLLDEERDPTDAVVEAWLGLQRTAEQSGIVRTRAETPTEFTRRIMGRVFTDDRPITALLALYLRARFGEREVTASDVAKARDALKRLARSWDATTVSAHGSPGDGLARPR